MDRRRTGRPAPLVALLAVYLVLLTWVVLWKLEVPYVGAAALLPRPVKLIPFVATAQAGASAPLEVLTNIALFVPFGVHLRLLAPSWRLPAIAGVLAGASLLLETTQHLLSVGSFDSTDVITNTAGGLIGTGIVVLARRRLGPRAPSVLLRACAIGTALALVGTGVFIASPLHLHLQRDVVVPASSAARAGLGSDTAAPGGLSGRRAGS